MLKNISMHHTSDENGAPGGDSLSRRSFLQSSAAAAAAGVSASAWLSPQALAGGTNTNDVLIHIFLRGGMDGLSLCVPHGDSELYSARPNLAIAPPGSTDGALDLDGFFGFAPALAGLMTPFSNRDLAVVHAAGSTDPTRSHFDSTIAIERGAPGQDFHQVGTGWLARHLDAIGGTAVMRALSMTDTMPFHLAGLDSALPLSDPKSATFPGRPWTADLRERAIRQMYLDAPLPMGAAMEASLASLALLESVGFDTYVPAGGAVYPLSPLGDRLLQSAALIKAGVGLESISIDFDGWDHHEGMGPIDGLMSSMLTDLAQSLEAFYLDLGTTLDSVTLMVMSEFGRRVAENGSLGADHGHGNCMLVMGGHVHGGRVFGTWPGLAPLALDSGDLAVTTDYRDVIWEILAGRMGATDVATVFPGHTPTPLGIIF